MHNVIAIIVVDDWLCWLMSKYTEEKKKNGKIEAAPMLRNVKK